MAARLDVVVIAAIVFAATILGRTEGAVHVVGDAAAWSTPSSTTFYSDWAAQYNFTVGDTLVFNFVNGNHDVATVTKSAYDNCNTANPSNLIQTPPANITLTSNGEHYYICTHDGHCSSGQKLAINVGNNSSTPGSPPSPPGTPSPPPPPPPSSASSLAATSFAIFVSIAMAILCYF